MEPGYELDKLIGMKVMGLSEEEIDYPNGPKFPKMDWDRGICDMFYSTEIEAAWKVVEKLTDSPNPHFEISRGRDGWFASFDLDRPFKRVTAKGETAPHAICLAALNSFKG